MKELVPVKFTSLFIKSCPFPKLKSLFSEMLQLSKVIQLYQLEFFICGVLKLLKIFFKVIFFKVKLTS